MNNTNIAMIFFDENFSLKGYNSFGFDVNARFWSVFETDQELIDIIKYCTLNNISWFILGGGSNIIFSGNFDGCIIHPVSKRIQANGSLVIADAGVVWDDLVSWSVDQGLGGLENLSSIPGTVGASPVQNIGAYGVEVKDVIEWVEYLDTCTLAVVRIAGSECKFGYRESIFKLSLAHNAIVLRVAFRLSSDPIYNINYADIRRSVEELGGASLTNIRRAIVTIRASKLPDPKVIGNAGSFFKNPIIDPHQANSLLVQYPDMPSFEVENGSKIPAAWLIDQAGWKGYRRGDAGVHPQHALVLVNYGTAFASQVLALADEIVEDVKQKFGVQLEKEVNVW